jgi:hypothetical protein
MSTSGERAGLLDLPQELRDQIYGYLMLKQKTHITMLPHYSCSQSLVSAAQPALCYVNKQIRTETLPIFYSSNLFLAELSDDTDLAVAKNWLAAIGNENLRHLRRLALCGWTRVTFGHMICRLWIRVVLDLKEGTLDIEGNEAKVDQKSHVVKDAKELKAAYAQMVASRGEDGFDADSLGTLMDGFHALCMSQ